MNLSLLCVPVIDDLCFPVSCFTHTDLVQEINWHKWFLYVHFIFYAVWLKVSDPAIISDTRVCSEGTVW